LEKKGGCKIPAGKTIYENLEGDFPMVTGFFTRTSLAGGLKYALTVEGYISHNNKSLFLPKCSHFLNTSLVLSREYSEERGRFRELTYAALSLFSKNPSGFISTDR
jgi:hypothetical protein